MNLPRALFLGGAYAQIPILKEAKKRGWHVVTCDYLHNNPGHQIADEYYNISTTNYEGVLSLAKKIRPDYVIAYATDPGAPIAAYIREKLNLPGNTYQSVNTLAKKDLFRELQKKNGFNTPRHLCLYPEENIFEKAKIIEFPVIVKPTDSSGSKGVNKVDTLDQLPAAVRYAMEFSRDKKIIVEEFIGNEQGDIHGDGFVINGELQFSCLGDHMYNGKTNPFNPVGTLWPTKQSKIIVNQINKDVAKLVRLSGFESGPINIEARVNQKGKIYITEIGPRSGGHFVPQAIEYATGFNMVRAMLDVMEKKEITIPGDAIHPAAYYAIHSDISGILKRIRINKRIQPFIKEFHSYIQPGNPVNSFSGANEALGILLMSFNNYNKMEHMMLNMGKYVDLEIQTAILTAKPGVMNPSYTSFVRTHNDNTVA